MWHWLIINCDFNLVWGGLYANSPLPQTPSACNSRDTCCGQHDKTSILLGDDSMFSLSLWSQRGGHSPLATNQFLNLHQHKQIMRVGLLFQIIHGRLPYACCMSVCICVYMYLFPRACVSLCLMSLIMGHGPDSHQVLSWLVISSAPMLPN